ncbi:MAG TPA: cell division protein FtsK, partial [Psychromonas hadalis]|nr:cell division protein FtsK [Psychromonas hadalis]
MSKLKSINHLSGFQKVFEVGIIVSLFSAIFIAISLSSFSAGDPSWSQSQWVAEIDNLGGPAGAWVADILFYSFGVVAYLVPVLIAFFAWLFFWQPKLPSEIDFFNLGLRIIGFNFTIFSIEALASLNFDDYHYYPSGGLIGDIITTSLLGFFSLLAVNLILLTLLISGTTLLLGFSWLRLIDGLGEKAIALVIFLYEFPSKLRERQENSDTRPVTREKK